MDCRLSVGAGQPTAASVWECLPERAMTLPDLPPAERPHARLLRLGASQLTDSELLAITLGAGRTGTHGFALARTLMARFRSLGALLAADAAEVCATPGLGRARYAGLHAGVELARRVLLEQATRRDALRSPQAVRDYLRLALHGRPVEVFMGVFLDAQNRVLCAEALFQGTLTQTSVYPREVVRRALHHNCAGIILAHNHPSGVAEPSEADRHLTRALREALALVDIRVLDHFVIGQDSATSFAERGLL